MERYIEKKAHQQEDKVGRMLGLAFSLLDDICDDELHDDEMMRSTNAILTDLTCDDFM